MSSRVRSVPRMTSASDREVVASLLVRNDYAVRFRFRPFRHLLLQAIPSQSLLCAHVAKGKVATSASAIPLLGQVLSMRAPFDGGWRRTDGASKQE